MKRRNFLKSSLILTSTLVATPAWIINDRIRFGYYYPAQKTPETFLKFVQLFQKAGIDAVIEDLTHMTHVDALKQVQQGQYAGVFMSTNLAALNIPQLMLLADGIDSPQSHELAHWTHANEVLIDESLKDYNLKRVPFLKVGPRRGVWVHQSSSLDTDLKGQLVYADGLWARMMAYYGAVPTQQIKADAPRFMLLSNLFVADQIKIPSPYKIRLFDTQPLESTQSSHFDFYVNRDYWQTLDQSHQQKISHYLIDDASKIEAYNKIQDTSLLESILAKPDSFVVFSETENRLFSKSLFQQMRIECATGPSSKKLVDSYVARFVQSEVNSRKTLIV